MAFVIIGVLLLAAKLAEFGPFANWSWWIILAPFAAAAIWWQLSDSLGLTQRRAMDKMEQRKVDRRAKQLEALGIDPKKRRTIGDLAQHDASKLGERVDPTQANGPGPR
ncbi:MAG: TIGR04438 family Trp-rich protein [Pseudomonadota bacterium]|nr:TIGR04438 family Trp-rich protein [Pseudomonadota bacterium]